MIDESLLTRLYGRREDGWLPYRVFGRYSTNGRLKIDHVPGKEGKHWAGDAYDLRNWTMLGYRGLLVQDYKTPVTDQQVKLCWAGIDVDAEDNGDRDLPTLVSDLLFNQALIRTSKSGKGVHCIFILHTPMLTDYATAGVYAKRIVAEPIKQLQAAGITKCVSGLPNLWLWSEGGLQRTVSDTGACVSLPGGPTPSTPVNHGSGDLRHAAAFTGMAKRVLERLSGAGVGQGADLYRARYNVNVGDVKRRLEGLVTIQTKSKCRPEHAHEVNGFIELTDAGELRLISNADDNQCILYLASF